MARMELPGHRKFKPDDILAVTPPNYDERVNEDGHNAIWADAGAPSDGRSRHDHGNDNDDRDVPEHVQAGEKGTGNGKGTKDEKVNRQGKGKGNGRGKGIVEQTTQRDDRSHVVALQLQMERYEAD
jgi:hypothetical protein